MVNYLASVLFNRILKFGVVQSEWFATYPIGGIYYFICGCSTFFQYFSHSLIALNRYTAFIHPLKHQAIWQGCSFAGLVAILFFAPFVLSFNRFLMEFKVVSSDGTFAYINTVAWINTANAVISIGVSLLTSLVSASLETRTLIEYRRLSRHRKRELREDFRLLIYALLGFIAQLTMAVYFGFSYIGMSTGIAPTVQLFFPYCIDLLSLGNSVCLLFTSKALRRAYVAMYGFGFITTKQGSIIEVTSTATRVRAAR